MPTIDQLRETVMSLIGVLRERQEAGTLDGDDWKLCFWLLADEIMTAPAGEACK